MPKSTSDYLRQLRQQKVFYDQLYRCAAETFELPDSAMWVLYHLSVAKPAGEISQQDLVDLTMLPKQTINSAVSGLVEEGLVELEPIPGTRNRKRILLTSEGEELAEETVLKLYRAECRALGRMGQKKMEQLFELCDELYDDLLDEFELENIVAKSE